MKTEEGRLLDADRALIRRALRTPRGRYSAGRASQLSAVPERTLYDWAKTEILVPDWNLATPRAWSYRDIVYIRLLAWLRSKDMPRAEASIRVVDLRALLANAEIDPKVRSDGTIMLVGDEAVDRMTGQQAFDGIAELLDIFHVAEPIDGVSRGELWGPSLVRPSRHTYISPWVMGGDPCLTDSRIPSASIYALSAERRLDPAQIAALYPDTTVEQIEDALALETRLRRAA